MDGSCAVVEEGLAGQGASGSNPIGSLRAIGDMLKMRNRERLRNVYNKRGQFPGLGVVLQKQLQVLQSRRDRDRDLDRNILMNDV